MKEYAKILLVEDDASLAQWVKEYLQQQGFLVDHLASGDIVVEHLNKGNYDLVLLDVMLPGLDGIEVCKQVRRFSAIPIIMMTARADEFDEVIGIEVGANDYVIKPVRPRALLARIKAMLRNLNNTSDIHLPVKELKFGELCLHWDFKRVDYKGERIDLSMSLFSLLWLLASNAGKVVDRDLVFQELKGREYDGLDRRFDVMISTLRRTFNDNPQKPEKIKTVWGKGYLFVPDMWND
ncbi:response regulator [Agaribacter flavus]|uniref:Response regulator n=1 Tax=Agaribacter flavus TaxID=1902781 RepID=A0ABV7FKM2_9ALTE